MSITIKKSDLERTLKRFIPQIIEDIKNDDSKMYLVTLGEPNGHKISYLSCVLGVYTNMNDAADALCRFLKELSNFKEWFSSIKQEINSVLIEEGIEEIIKNINDLKKLIINYDIANEILFDFGFRFCIVPLEKGEEFGWDVNGCNWHPDYDFTLVYVFAERALQKRIKYEPSFEDIRKRMHYEEYIIKE